MGLGKFNNQEAIIEEELMRLMSRMDTLIAESKDSAVYMKKFFSVSALNIIWSLIAGYKFSHDDEQLHKLVKLMSDIVQKLAVGEDIITAYPVLRHIVPRFTQTGKDRKDFLTAMHGFFKVSSISIKLNQKFVHKNCVLLKTEDESFDVKTK